MWLKENMSSIDICPNASDSVVTWCLNLRRQDGTYVECEDYTKHITPKPYLCLVSLRQTIAVIVRRINVYSYPEELRIVDISRRLLLDAHSGRLTPTTSRTRLQVSFTC